jgi:asparagine synthase (glutamine-hydrolysing)
MYGLLKLLTVFVSDRGAYHVIQQVLKEKLSYLGTLGLVELYESTALVAAGQKGIIIEAGCALGGSALVIAAAKRPSQAFYVYDTFGMIPPPSERDGQDAHERYGTIVAGESNGIRGDPYYGYEKNLYQRVQATFSEFGYPTAQNNIHLVQGLFEDTLVTDEPVALAHIDSDWYDSVLTCMQRIEPQLVRGGVLIVDDYDAWSGCRAAIDDYFADKREDFDFVFRSRLHIIRK